MSKDQPIEMTRAEAADRRIASALRDIEAAQNLLANASAALSSLHGLPSLRIMDLHARVKAAWYRLHDAATKDRRGGHCKILLSHEPNGYESEWGPLP